MLIRAWKGSVPLPMRQFIKRLLKLGASKARRESNIWLMQNAQNVGGVVLSIGSGTDEDQEGRKYRDYFKQCSSYTTSELTSDFNPGLVLDVRSMPEIADESFDCIFCSGVLEHVDDFHAGIREMTRILKAGGFLILGLPFRQALHLVPYDYWRFTEYSIRHLLKDKYEIVTIAMIDETVKEFPAAYWVKARKV